jgi:glycerol-3-phosphate acyltransferase PlsX
MGGDNAPRNEIEGAIAALQHPRQHEIELVFVGREPDIRSVLSTVEAKDVKFSIVHADEVVGMDEDPTSVFKKKKNSSLYKGLELHASGKVDAFVSAGNTGAVMSVATLLLGRIQGVSRPTIGSFLPNEHNTATLVLDVGANAEVKPKFLYEFAVMGSIYTRQIRGVEKPRVGLLNIGEEPTKGTEIVQQAYQELAQSNLNFIGNVEGRDIFKGTADVVVCDGFTGNVVLKFAESMLGLLKARFRSFASQSLLNKLAMAMVLPTLKKVLKGLDYQEYGGVPLLGVKGVVIIGHGSSTPVAIKNMILVAEEMVAKGVNRRIEQALTSA